jgi:hypothetical protein
VAGGQRVSQQHGEQERREVVDLEGQLVTVGGDRAPRSGYQSGVADQDVDPRVLAAEVGG